VGGVDPVLAVTLGLVAGLVGGAINGFLVAFLGLSAFIATLATMTSFSGLALLLSNGTTIFGLPESFVWLGQGRVGPIPVPVIIAVVLALIVWFVLSKTVIGRS